MGGVAAAAYTLIGSQARQSTSTTTYTFVCYGTCATFLAVACVAAGQARRLPAEAVGLLLLVTDRAADGALGFHHLLATTKPVVVSLALLLEVPGAALIAAVILGQVPLPARPSDLW